ncbi:hypothetical protein OC835_005420 [Tilletia horrida]|nr:hypothetical protein OC835_005420 [Tilletia horrida]
MAPSALFLQLQLGQQPESASSSSLSSSSSAPSASYFRSNLSSLGLTEVSWSTLASLTVLAIVLLFSSRFLLSVRKIYNAPLAVSHLRGPPIKHWFLGSYSKRELSGGKFTHRILADIKKYGHVHGSVLLGRRPHIVVADSKVATKVLMQALYPKVPSSLAFMRRHVGRGLLGEEGEAHRRQRKIAAPAFTQAAVNAMHGTIKEKSLSLVDRINRMMDSAETGQPTSDGLLINCSKHFNKMALDIIGSVGFGYEFNALYEDCRTPLDDAFAALMASMSTGTRYAMLRGRFGAPVERVGRLFRVREQVELDLAMRTVQNVSRVLVARAKAQVLKNSSTASVAAADDSQGEKDATGASRSSEASSSATSSSSSPTTSTTAATSSSIGSEQRRSDGTGGRRVSSADVAFGLRTHSDLLSLMVRANMSADLKPSQRLSDAELRGMVPAMLSAGHETASTALSWACHALTQQGHGLEVQRRLRAELLESGTAWQEDAASLHALPYLDAVVRETLRLHSPIRGLRRLVPHDDVLPLSAPIRLQDGTETKELLVKKGTVLFFSLIAINTDDAVWGDGMRFRPERWLDESHEYSDLDSDADADDADMDGESVELGLGLRPGDEAATSGARPRREAEQYAQRREPGLKNVWSSILSFGMGPTSCIGMRVALMEIKAGLAALLSNFELLPAHLPGEAPVDVDYLIQIVAHPVVKGREKEGTQVPIRIRRLPGVPPTPSILL